MSEPHHSDAGRAADRFDRPLVCIGGGSMASAVILGALTAGVLDPSRVLVADRNADKRRAFEHEHCTASPDPAEAVRLASEDSVVLLAIKPQSLPSLAQQVGDLIGKRTVISVLAGVRTQQVRAALGGRCPVIRAMPNTPARIGHGVTGMVRGEGVSAQDFHAARALFASIGTVHDLDDEALMPVFTLLAASGPAYVFLMAEALEQAAIRLGLPDGQARSITAEMIEGAAMLMRGSNQSPEQLRAAVTSKGGVTAAAVTELERAALADAFAAALAAGVKRDAELSAGSG